jgi:RNA polymerase primary sigma factor
MELNNNSTDEVDVMKSYMTEVGEIDLLSPDEEAALFKDMHAWTKSRKCTESIRLKGAKARNMLISSNLRLVIKIANEFRGLGMEFADLISEGNLGLMSAVDKYDPDKGAKLSYYASFWIKQSVRRSISNKARTIRTPVGMVDAKLKVQKYIESQESEVGEKPSDKKISRALKIPLKKVNKLLKLNLSCDSLNAKMADGENETGDLLVNENLSVPSEDCELSDDNLILSGFLSDLDKRQRYIIIRRFGLDGNKPETLENIGKTFNLTRERIRQLELAALRGLRDMYRKINKSRYME